MSLVISVISHYDFEGTLLVLAVQVPAHYIFS